MTNRLAEVVNTAEMGYNFGRGQRNSMETLLSKMIAWAQTQPDMIALYLYGSQAHGTANTLSDVDVAILVQPDLSRSQLWRLEDQWASQWPEWVDLRVLNLAPLSVRYEVTAHGQRLWAADTGIVAEIESLIWRQYWDLRPRLEQDWTQYVEHATEMRNEVERTQYQAALAKVRAVHQRVREAAASYTEKLQK
jgi:predicted nucleotidyltransferase